MPKPQRLLIAMALVLVLALAVQLHAQTVQRPEPPKMPPEWPEPPKMPEPPARWPPPIREPPIQPPRPPIQPPRPPIPPVKMVLVELKGYIEARVVDPIDPMRYPGRTEYFLRALDGKRYRLDLSNAKFYLCGPLISYVGTGKLVIVKGYLVYGKPIEPVKGDVTPNAKTLPDVIVIGGDGDMLFATEVRDPAYPCKPIIVPFR